MTRFSDSPFESQLEAVATLADRTIEARVQEQQRDDDLTAGLRQALRSGVGIDELSDASGLSPKEITRRMNAEAPGQDELAHLAGSV